MIIALSKLHFRRVSGIASYVLLALGSAEGLLRALIERARHAQAIRDLRYLDDRMLADIGLQRSEIERYVTYGR